MGTMVFNLFVWLQVFNQFNARKIMDKEWNVFSGLLNDCAFLAITVVTITTQLLAVTYMGRPLRVNGLSMDQHLYTIGMAAGIFLWNPLQMILFKPTWFSFASNCVPNKEASEDEQEDAGFASRSSKSGKKFQKKLSDSFK